MSISKTVLRSYKSEDKEALLNLIDLNIPNYFAPSEKLDFQNYLEKAIELYYVLLYEDKIIGCGGINFEEGKKVGIISWDMIHPEFHGKSFGTQLLQHRLSKLISMKTIKKVVVRTSQITYKFYEKQGFVLKEMIPNYWAEGFDLYFMEYENLEN